MADPALPSEPQRVCSLPLDLETLVAEHGPVLYRYAYRLTGSPADADDLTQQVFLTALAKLNQLREPTAARAWLFAVLRRAFLRQMRKPQPQPAADFEMNVDLLAVELPDELAFDGEELQQAIGALPEEYRLVLVGFYFEDCSYKELAERLELPIGTVMSRLSRAKGYLRAHLLRADETSAKVAPRKDTPLRDTPLRDTPLRDTEPTESRNGPAKRSANRVRGELR